MLLREKELNKCGAHRSEKARGASESPAVRDRDIPRRVIRGLAAWASAVAGVIALLSLAVEAQQINISNLVQVSMDNAERNHDEVIIAADPSDPARLLACSMIEPSGPSIEASRNVAYLSRDGGLHWSSVLEFGGGLWSSDPSCVFGRSGLAVYAALRFDTSGKTRIGRTVLYRSVDGGATWSPPSLLPEGDREFITMDSEGNKIYMGEIVDGVTFEGNIRTPLVLYESRDGAQSFQTRAMLWVGDEVRVFGYPGGVLPDGMFATAFSDIPLTSFIAGKSGGARGSVRVLEYAPHSDSRVLVPMVSDLQECDAWRNSSPMPSLAVDESNGIFRGRMYLAWPDVRSGRCEILFSSSADAGKTWSVPIQVNDDHASPGANAGPDDFHPVVAVNSEGVVGVLWYDRRADSDNLSWQPRFSASLDGGQTFLPSVTLDSQGMRIYQGKVLNLGLLSDGGGETPFRSGGVIRTSFGYPMHGMRILTGGETAGLAADAAGAFHALWIDNRTGFEQVWTARIWVVGGVEKNGSADLASLEDVSNDVAVLFSQVRLDQTNQSFTADVYVQNISDAVIYTPLKLRALRLGSGIGGAEFENADHGRTGSNTIFDLSSLMPGNGLKPGERTRGKQITVRLLHPLSQVPAGDYDALSRVVTIDCVVLAKRTKAESQP